MTAFVLLHGSGEHAGCWARRTSRRVLGKETIEIDAGHCPHVSKAEEVARILDRLGAEGSAS
jgi:hypothetical protein